MRSFPVKLGPKSKGAKRCFEVLKRDFESARSQDFWMKHLQLFLNFWKPPLARTNFAITLEISLTNRKMHQGFSANLQNFTFPAFLPNSHWTYPNFQYRSIEKSLFHFNLWYLIQSNQKLDQHLHKFEVEFFGLIFNFLIFFFNNVFTYLHQIIHFSVPFFGDKDHQCASTIIFYSI